ncbi:hypothetical protein NQZ68_008186 [Dissostichus eleginoides]|nr:hypothetical protein NQZ68_008186 [Dissostichus eleginoides]
MLPLPFVLPIIPEERSQLTLPPEQRSALRSPSAATTTAAAAPLSASPRSDLQSVDRGEKGRRDGVMGDQREDRGGLKGGHWSKSSREKVSSLPVYPPPAD